MLKILSTLFYTVFVTLVVGVAGLLLGTMLAIPGNIELKIVKSGSMEPAVPTGSVVVVKPAAEYRFGDVITFGEDTATAIPTTHRVIGVQGEGAAATYTTKGDANEEADPQPVQRRDIIGKVILSVPYAGYVLDFARQPLGFVLLIAIPAALVILEELLAIAREIKAWRRGRGGRLPGQGGTLASSQYGPASARDGPASPSGGPGSGKTLDLRGARRFIYTRHRLMDEILVPMLEDVHEHFARRMHARPVVPVRADAYGISTALVICLVFTSALFTGASGGTIAYFHDIEASIDNMLATGATWEAEALAAFAAFREQQEALVSAAAFSAEITEEPCADGCGAGKTEGEVLGETDVTELNEQEAAEEEPKEEQTIEEAQSEPKETELESVEAQTNAEEPDAADEPAVEPLGKPSLEPEHGVE
ncbi:MAG TPA: signal peptidase I [Candidatus Paceibacterota bacterium]|nr:signal peptidase I [Candidatus Paceibacterota bacterium]